MRSAYAEPMPLKWSIFLVAREKYESLSLFANIKTSFFLENAYPLAISPANKILLGLTTTNFQTRCYPNIECNKFSCFQFAESTSFRLRFSFVTKTFINIEYKMRIYYSICTEKTQWFRKCMRVRCAPRAPSLSPLLAHIYLWYTVCVRPSEERMKFRWKSQVKGSALQTLQKRWRQQEYQPNQLLIRI